MLCGNSDSGALVVKFLKTRKVFRSNFMQWESIDNNHEYVVCKGVWKCVRCTEIPPPSISGNYSCELNCILQRSCRKINYFCEC
jgi:hypothetical protein